MKSVADDYRAGCVGTERRGEFPPSLELGGPIEIVDAVNQIEEPRKIVALERFFQKILP
jgi:hypothetical protein